MKYTCYVLKDGLYVKMAEAPVGEKSEVERWMLDALAAAPLGDDVLLSAMEFFAPKPEGVCYYERPNGDRVYLGVCKD